MGRLIGWIVAGGGFLALVLAGLWLAQADHAAEVQDAPRAFVVPVRLVELERADLQPRAALSGTVRAARRAQLGFDTSGIVRALDVDEAAVVAEGESLAHLRRGDEEHEVAAARAALELARRERDLLVAGERDEEKRRLFAVLEATRAEAELARLEVERGEKLLADHIIAQSEQDRRSTAHNAADKRRAAAEEDYSRAIAGTRAEDLAIAAARVEEAQTRVATAMHALGKTDLVAPWSGSIVRRFVSVGDYASAGDPVFELVDLEHLEVHVEIPARFAPMLGSRSSVRMTLNGQPAFAIEKELTATIPAADESARSFRGIVRLDAGDDAELRLKPGMFVQLEVFLTPLENELVLPSDCVLANERGTYVVRALPAEGGDHGGMIADFVPVRVLGQVDGRSAVMSAGPPLDVGDAIVLVGGDNAFPGAALAPRNPNSEGQQGHSPSGGDGQGQAVDE